jgi:hypothetical protein
MVGGTGAGAITNATGDPAALKVNANLGTGTTVSTNRPLSSRLAQSDPALLKLTGTAPTSVLVKLDYDPLATYRGDLAGLPATSPQVTGHKLNVSSPAAVAYSGHINNIQGTFVTALHAAVPTAAVGQTYHTVYGGVAVQVPADKVASLLNLPGAVAIQADSLHQPDATTVADDDAEFIGGNAA